MVGESGLCLSEGQKARISLARALYAKSDIYLLDDPFNAIDSKVSRALFEEVIIKFLAKKTVLLVTHQLNFLDSCVKVMVM